MSRRVRRHDSALTSPQKTSSNTQQSTSNNGESLVLVMVVIEERASVEDIGGATCGKGEMGSEDVVDTTTEDSEDSEGGVECGVGVVCGCVVDLATTTHA